MRLSGLDDSACVHHIHTLADRECDTKVVGDQDHPKLVPITKSREKFENFFLCCDIERRRRLVGDQNLGVLGDRRCDTHSLTHASGKFEGVELEHGRVDDADLCEHAFGLTTSASPRSGRPRSSRDRAVTCTPTRCSGLSIVNGSCITTATSEPRSRRRSPSPSRASVAH